MQYFRPIELAARKTSETPFQCQFAGKVSTRAEMRQCPAIAANAINPMSDS